MLRFNTFRAARFLRSKFVEGKFLLASEATDLELELLDLLRRTVQFNLGDNVAVDSAWQVQRLSATQVLIKPGEAWFKGLPFTNRFGKDQLVSGSILSVGTVPVGVTVADDSNGLGKIVTFNNAATTPTNLYRCIITAREELITTVQDPFLKNVNLTEDTEQKIRLNFQLNIVPDSLQSESPIPYRDEGSTSASVTNFPNSGGFASPNLVNQIQVSPSSGQNGELLLTTVVSGSQGIDGRSVELTIRNDPSLGGGNPIPNSTISQQSFYNGKLIDSNGSVFYVNAIFNDTVNTQCIVRIDKEPNQQNPEIINGKPYFLVKREVFVTDDVNGSPQGKLQWPFATINWNQTTGIVHSSSITDLRDVIRPEGDFQDYISQKTDLTITGGGSISWGITSAGLLTWSSTIELLNAYGAIQTIAANSAGMLDGGSLVYELNLNSGGAIDRGTLLTTTISSGSTVNVSALTDLSNVRIGNILKVGTQLVQITGIDNVSKQLQVSPNTLNTGSATIYMDSFAPGTAQLSENSFVLAVMRSNRVWISGGSLELESGESSEIGDGISDQLLTFMGATSEHDMAPHYTSHNHVTEGNPLNAAISQLDAAVGAIDSTLAIPVYDERILYPSGLASGTHITLPNNSRNSGNPEFYTPGDGKLQIYQNQLVKFAGIDYVEFDNQHIYFNYDLPNDTEVHFRIGTLGGSGGGGGGGGSQSLQDTYNIGRVINVTTGNPVELHGSGKLLHAYGDIQVDGVVDPSGLQLTPQSGNPLQPGQTGVWANLSNELNFENGSFTKNLTQAITNLESGTGTVGLSRLMLNGTGSTIPAGTPVYSPSPGQIAPADGSAQPNSRAIGVTAESIAPSSNGRVTYVGMVQGVSGFTHGKHIYLTATPGIMTDVEPNLGTYSAGFSVVIIGVIEGTNLMLQIQDVGVL